MALSKRQLELRRSGVGASEIATIAGLSRWGSLIDVWRSKVDPTYQRPDETYRMSLGTEVEAPLAKVWAKARGLYLARVDTLRHPVHTFALATPDRAVFADPKRRGNGRLLRTRADDADLLLQVKSSSWRMRSAWGRGVDVFDTSTAAPAYSDEIPDEYWAQVQWELGVAQQQTAAVIVDFDKTTLYEYRVSFDAEIFGRLYEIASRFMVDHVLAGRAPEPDFTEAYASWVAERFPSERDRNAAPRPLLPEHEPEVWAAVRRSLALREVAARVEAQLETDARRIELAIGEGTGLQWSGGKVTWLKNRDGQRVDYAARALELERIAGAAIMGLTNGLQSARAELHVTLAGQLEAARAGFVSATKGPRVMRWKVDGAPKLGTSPAPVALEVGDQFLDLPRMSAPRVTPAPAEQPAAPTKEGIE